MEQYLISSLFNFQVVDLPCVVESLKTIDKKSFYKTADICQMVRELRSFVESYFNYVKHFR